MYATSNHKDIIKNKKLASYKEEEGFSDNSSEITEGFSSIDKKPYYIQYEAINLVIYNKDIFTINKELSKMDTENLKGAQYLNNEIIFDQWIGWETTKIQDFKIDVSDSFKMDFFQKQKKCLKVNNNAEKIFGLDLPVIKKGTTVRIIFPKRKLFGYNPYGHNAAPPTLNNEQKNYPIVFITPFDYKSNAYTLHTNKTINIHRHDSTKDKKLTESGDFLYYDHEATDIGGFTIHHIDYFSATQGTGPVQGGDWTTNSPYNNAYYRKNREAIKTEKFTKGDSDDRIKRSMQIVHVRDFNFPNFCTLM